MITFYFVNRVSLGGEKKRIDQRNRQKENDDSIKEENYFTIFNSIWYFVCVFFQEGIYKTPKYFDIL
jgi:hypothetical protein